MEEFECNPQQCEGAIQYDKDTDDLQQRTDIAAENRIRLEKEHGSLNNILLGLTTEELFRDKVTIGIEEEIKALLGDDDSTNEEPVQPVYIVDCTQQQAEKLHERHETRKHCQAFCKTLGECALQIANDTYLFRDFPSPGSTI